MIFVALELTSISLYILTAFHKGSLRSAEAALKYFMFGAVSSAFLLFGLAWIYGATGQTSLVHIREAIAASGWENAGGANANMILAVGVVFTIVGFGFKVAAVPFHLWAPDAYEGAPTPVTAFIATASKLASYIVAAKVLLIAFPALSGLAFWRGADMGWTPVLAVLAVLSMVVGNCAAIVQRNVKRLLAYSSIAHAGYILVGLIGAGSSDPSAQKFGMVSVMFYVVIYALTTLGAFGVVHAMEEKAGGCELAHLNGMSKRAPFLSLLLLVFVLSLTGVPPLAGFFGKFYLFAAAVRADPSNLGLLWLVWFGVITSAVSLYYYLIVLKHVYVLSGADESRVETSLPVRLTMGLTGAAVVLLGVYPSGLLNELGNSFVFLPLR
jgi:NADH-quinone oxidoreductase subunit N